jgi:hypothetical protein
MVILKSLSYTTDMISFQSFDYCYGRHLPKLGSTRTQPAPIIHAKFFDTVSNKTWYVIEGEKIDNTYLLYGYVTGQSNTLKEFTFKQLEDRKTVEISILFKPRPLTGTIDTSTGQQ